MKFKLASFCAVFFLCSIFNHAFSQTLQVSGTVTKKASGEPLAGASVVVRGGGVATRTAENGSYSLNIPQKSATLVVSYSGMVMQEQRISQSGTLNFALEEEVNTLSDVVVIGYGTQKVTKVSGAVATVSGTNLEKIKPTRIDNALQGQVSGVNIIQNGAPGSTPTIFVRGIPSYRGSDPLVIIDGSFQTLSDFNSIAPSDIESVSVLKDAATTSIYGVRGGSGVIVVTTKAGRKNQKTVFSVSANYGVQEVVSKLGVLNATEYAAMVNEGSTVSGGPVIFPDISIFGKGTNWQDEVFQRAPVQNHSLSASGGSDRLTYFLSAAYSSQGGIVGGYDKSRFNRGTFTANLNFDLTSRLKLILNTTGVLLNSKGIQENSFNSVLGSAINFDPTVEVYNNVANTVGQYGFSNRILSEIYNPLTKLENTYNVSNGNKLYGKLELQYKVIKGLTLTSRFGYTKYNGNGRSFTPLVFYGPLNVDNSMNADGSTTTGKFNSVNQNLDNNFNFTWDTYANYNFKIAEKHNFETTAGGTLYKSSGNGSSASRQDVPFNSWEFATFSAATGVNTSTNPNASNGGFYQYFGKNASMFGRVNYDFNEKYLASASVRRDGSINFGEANRFAFFYSGSLGWVVSKEDFFNSTAIDFLKLRASYGTVGIDNVSRQSSSIVNGGPSYGSPANSNGYTFGNVFTPGATLGGLVNPNLKWEEQKQFNAGFDIAVLNNKLTLNADYYEKRTNGQLFFPALPWVIGQIPAPAANLGDTRSNGIDLTLTYNNQLNKNFKFGSVVTFTTVNNKVLRTDANGVAKVPGPSFYIGQSQSVTLYEKGQSPGYFYGYVTDGLFQNAAEIAAGPTQAGAVPGDIRYKDLNDDGQITSADQTKIGDPFADFTVGWNLTLGYKNFDFSAFTYASSGNDMYRAYERNGPYTNKFRSVLGRWTGEGSTNDARTPRYTFADLNNNNRVSDRFVEDASFIKIKDIQLGFTLPSSIVKNVFKSMRIYGQVRNAFTFTKYSGFDPELGGGIFETGVDKGAFPQARTYAVGIDFKF
ncbi:MAG: TonB-dependent receptor [Chitinophagaceae bacterium]|nr:MAG: TonB-dependent receptor [Chitinophagaceae bacterium]